MWDFDSLLGKARVYFERAQQHTHSDDDEFAIWILLGIEFLMRAVLSSVHPTLLASPDGDSILSAAGVPILGEPRSVPTATVIKRLGQIVPDFDKTRATEAFELTNLRNAELHTGLAAVANVSNAFWLPKATRVVRVIADHLSIDFDDLLGAEVVELGDALIDAEDKKVAHEVSQAIATATAFLARLSEEELKNRTSAPMHVPFAFHRIIKCPACKNNGVIVLDHIRTAADRVEDNEIVRDNVYVAREFECPVCALKLNGTAEIVAAGLEQQFVGAEAETFEEIYSQNFVDYDYGND